MFQNNKNTSKANFASRFSNKSSYGYNYSQSHKNKDGLFGLGAVVASVFPSNLSASKFTNSTNIRESGRSGLKISRKIANLNFQAPASPYKVFQNHNVSRTLSRLASSHSQNSNSQNPSSNNFATNLSSNFANNFGNIYENRVKGKSRNQKLSRRGGLLESSLDGISASQKQWNVFQLVASIGLVFCLVMLYQTTVFQASQIYSLDAFGSGLGQVPNKAVATKTAGNLSIINNFSDETLGKQASSNQALVELPTKPASNPSPTQSANQTANNQAKSSKPATKTSSNPN